MNKLKKNYKINTIIIIKNKNKTKKKKNQQIQKIYYKQI